MRTPTGTDSFLVLFIHYHVEQHFSFLFSGLPNMRAEFQDLPALSIRRPLLVLVINLLIALAGIAAIFAVEVRELPDVDRPIITVRAEYPGASPETMDTEVTSLVEGAVARVSGVKTLRSSSEENNMRMRVEFLPSVKLEDAAADVREAVSRVERELPDNVEQLVVVKADEDSSPVMRIAAQSRTLDEASLTRVLEKDVVPSLIAVEGVADVPLFGERQRLLRVAVDPPRLTSLGLSVAELAEVLRNAQFDVPAGSFRSRDHELLLRANASVMTEDQVEALIIRDTIRVGDVAEAVFGPEDASSYVLLNGEPVIGLGIVRQAQSNTIEISRGVRQAVAALNERLDNLELRIIADEATFIQGSVREVLITLGLTVLIVITTIWLFFGSLRATLVPSVAIPLALIGTLAAIWLFGFSVNILTLLALVLATGLVVDDAIVVLENIQRHRALGVAPRAAAVLGTRQVFFAVVATSAVLISVFVPIAFLPGTAGRLFREFGLVLAVAVAISSFVALSLVASLGARLPASAGGRESRHPLSRLGRSLARLYGYLLDAALRLPWLILLLALAAGGGAIWLSSQLDQELLPEEDRGVIYAFATGPDGVGLGYTERQVVHMENLLRPLVENGEATDLFTIVGRYDLNRAHVTLPLVDWAKRKRSQQQIISELRGPLGEIPGARIRAYGSNSLNLRGAGSGLEIALLGNDYLYLYEEAKKFARLLEEVPFLSDPDISYQPTQPQLSVEIDRRRASDLGIPLENLAATLRTLIDGDELVDLNVADQAIPIFLESRSGRIRDPSDLVNLYVTTRDGQLLPLSTVVSLKEEGVAAELDRHAQRRAVEIDLDLEPGEPLQNAVDATRELARAHLPPEVNLLFLGEAATLEETSREVLWTYALALLVVFLVLAAQFENLTSPLIITLIVPFGFAAAVYALLLSGTSINVYSQIGLVMLIGLMAKNSILLVEFADQLRDQGVALREAVITGASVRLRPIVMTLMSTVLGGLPLILGSGPGAEARTSIGWVVFGGLGLAALFTLFLTPVVYLALARFSKPRAEETARLQKEMQAAEAMMETGREKYVE